MQLTIDRLGHQGDGIAQGASGPVFVPRSLPGEVIAARITGRTARTLIAEAA